MLNQALGRDVRVPIQHRCARQFLGSEYGGWCVCPDRLHGASTLYCFGVGEDISFDLALIKRFGAHVHAFDPTPKSIRWIRSQQLPAEFQFHEIGIADYDGVAKFSLPRADYVSFTMDQQNQAAETVEAPVKRLKTIMESLGHESIDLLKMDIEGAECKVIDDIANSNVPIGQLLVEYHHRIGNSEEVARTRASIRTINAMGFKLFFQSANGREFSFVYVG